MPDRVVEAVKRWQDFANNTYVVWAGRRRTWASHISGSGYVDEERLLQPTAFPAFARELLGFEVGVNLAPEETGAEGKPDFTPADSVTHAFVFETKGTSEGIALSGHEHQVSRYLTDGRPRIREVVVTNLVGIRVFSLDEHGLTTCVLEINLVGLLGARPADTATTRDARDLADFLDKYSRKELTDEEKLERVRQAPGWNPVVEITSSSWLVGRVDSVVQLLTADAQAAIRSGVLLDPSVVDDSEREQVLKELQSLGSRVGMQDPEAATLQTFLHADPSSAAGKALTQYAAHVAYYAATRLMLVRVWEDLELLEPTLYDGGFHEQMVRFGEVVDDVVAHSFTKAKARYRSLFEQNNNYSWYSPSTRTYVELIYQLASTYFGSIQSDVLGQVYERMLERIDRKLLGQYYTPRDIIKLIWDLIDLDAVAGEVEQNGREPRVLDIATGSGGFLVEAATRLRKRLEGQRAAGASVDPQLWMNSVAEGLNGAEIQHFSAYLAELNLLVQLGHVVALAPNLRLPAIGVLSTDSLSLHQSVPSDGGVGDIDAASLPADRLIRAKKIKDPKSHDFWIDVACGNPPYIGQKTGAPIMARTRQAHPYWNLYVGPHMDYLYWFLILGLSKLRAGGRFGFITTEYWLRSAGARPLRGYIAENCEIDRIILFRDLRLFPDAPGQHSMVITGRRCTDPDPSLTMGSPPTPKKPKITIFEGATVTGPVRAAMLAAMASGANGRRAQTSTFNAPIAPQVLGDASWSEVVLTAAQVRKRRALRAHTSRLELDTDEGVLSAADRMRRGYEVDLTQATLSAIGWPGKKAGIFALAPDEVAALGPLTATETESLRPVVNTKDVLPYAAVLASDAASMIYLPSPEFPPETDLAAKRAAPIPADLPAIGRHLTQFRPLLEKKVESYGERRPWWSLHRPRPDIVGREDRHGWGDYVLTTRWGAGERLVAGLAPAGSVPASGLQALMPVVDVPAAYVCGVLNSGPVQDLAETLPPGKVTAEDIRELGLPLVTDFVDGVVTRTVELAGIVRGLATGLARRFPSLIPHLLEDISLTAVPEGDWLATPGSATAWGSLSSVTWLSDVESRGSLNQLIGEVTLSDDLYGVVVTAHGRRGSATVTLHLVGTEAAHVESLVAYVKGAAAAGVRLSEVPSLPAPIGADALASAYGDDRARLLVQITRYRELRAQIDELVSEAL